MKFGKGPSSVSVRCFVACGGSRDLLVLTMDLEALRSLVLDCIDKHCYRSAIFFGDKLCILSSRGDKDVYLLCQAYYYSGQYRRALLHLTRHIQQARKKTSSSSCGGGGGGGGAAADTAAISHHAAEVSAGAMNESSVESSGDMHLAFKYLTAKCLAECKEWERCLQVLEEASGGEETGGSDDFRDGRGGGGGAGDIDMDLNIASFSKRMEASDALEASTAVAKRQNGGGGGDLSAATRRRRKKKDRIELESCMCVLRAKCYESMDNRERAKQFYKRALEQSDPFCYEALEALIGNHMLSSEEESDLFKNLDIVEPEHNWLRLLYECKGKKYGKVEQVQSKLQKLELKRSTMEGFAAAEAAGTPSSATPMADNPQRQQLVVSGLSQSLDVLTCKAEFLYHCCEYRQCYEVTQSVLDHDPYFLDCLPVHLACACELNKKNDLFLLGHKLVEEHPEKAVSWFAVGCYYMCISQFDSAERYFQKATNIEKDFAPAWIGYGHAFACQDESDQAMAAYRTATRLFIGLHFPLLCLGVEYMRTNSLPLAEEFFNKAKAICPEDPLIYHELGVLAFQRKQYSVAVKQFRKALNLIPNPFSTVTWEPTVNNLAHALRKVGKYQEAIEMYTKALALKPKQANTYSAMAFTYQLMNQPHKAIELYHKSLGIEDDAFTSDMLFVALKEVAHPDMLASS